MWWKIGLVANGVVACAYLLIVWAILSPLLESKQLRSNPLGAATAAIFFTCAVHHGSHVVHMLLPYGSVEVGHGLAMRAAYDWEGAIWDVVTAAVGVYYWTLRRTYGSLMHGAQLFEDMRERERQALELNDAVLQGMVVAKLALDVDQTEQASNALEASINSASRMISELLGPTNDSDDKRLLRSKAASLRDLEMTQVAEAVDVRVLIVDDTPDMRLMLRVVLNRYRGFSVVSEAGDGAAAIDAAAFHQPDLVLLDLAMPVMDGLEALPHIRQAAPDSRVIILSGFQAERMAQSALASGASAYIQKGIRPDGLVEKIAEVLDRPVPALKRPPKQARPNRVVEENPSIDSTEHVRRAVATAAHELRNPAIALGVLSDELLSARHDLAREAVDQILEAIARQADIIDQLTTDLLTATHARRGSLMVRPEPLNVFDALNSAIRTNENPAAVELSCPRHLTAMADPIRLNQMVTNLVSNAKKYGAPPVQVSASLAADKIILRVRDHGEGVPEWFRKDLFTEYARAEPFRGEGTGLGLHIVRSIALAHGGDAWYEPVADGAQFALSVPAVVEHERSDPSGDGDAWPVTP